MCFIFLVDLRIVVFVMDVEKKVGEKEKQLTVFHVYLVYFYTKYSTYRVGTV